MARVLVAGAAGFVGSHLTDRLLADGHEVVGVDDFITGNPRNLAHLDTNKAFSFVQHDVIEPLTPIPGRFDRIYNLASPASPIDYLKRPFETLYAGSDGTRNLLRRAEQDGARFFITSTSEVYGDPQVHPQPESYWGNVNPIGPRSVYDEAKRYAEAITMAFHRYKGVEVRIARLFNTFGPRMRHDDGRVIPAFCCQAIRGEPITVFGDGSQTRSYCYVSDLVDGLVKLMESDLTEPCNLGNPYELTVRELATVIVEAAGSSSTVTFKPLPADDPKLRRPDITRARAELGWDPKVPFAEGLATTLEFFRTVV
jgi:dTDP-glucose 4,6-dehydratase